MAYRRRDSARGGYSSADAYRAVPSNRVSATSPPSPPSSSSHAHSSEEEAHLTSPTPYTPDPRRAESPFASEQQHESESPLVPPKPFFLGGNRKDSSGSGSDRHSWNSLADSSDVASDSDRDHAERDTRARQATVPSSSSASVAAARRARANTTDAPTSPTGVRPRNHNRRRSSSITGSDGGRNPFETPPPVMRAPPSSFPFLSHAGNPDPGTPIPGQMARRASHESFRRLSGSPPNTATGVAYPAIGVATGGYSVIHSGERSSMDVADGGMYYAPNGYDSQADLGRPYAPFMTDADRSSWQSSNGSNGNATPPGAMTPPGVYRTSAAAAINGSSAQLAASGDGTLPRTNSQPQIAMRAPFLSPASRPSSIWSPPSYPSFPAPTNPLTSTYPPSLTYLPSSPYSSSALPYHLHPKRARTLMPSSRLEGKLTKEDKPWLKEKSKRERISWWLTLFMIFLGVGAAGVVCYFGWTGVHQLKDDQLCMVLNEEFNTLDLSNTWFRDVELGGFGNGEFQMTTASNDNLYVQNGELYMVPTLTSDEIGESSVLNGYTYSLGNDCTAGQSGSSDASGAANCSATSDGGNNVIPPVKSSRISTQGHYSIQFGKVEVRAKLPRGDWLWPAIWMLPTDTSKYGQWPLSGEIDIMEARGNPQSYPAQGVNYVRSSLNYGVLDTLQTHLIGWWQEKRFTYAEDFHVYGFEWTPDWMRFYVDSRLQAMMNIKITGKGGKSFFDRAGYPLVAHNNSDTEVAIQNIWQNAGGTTAAPFDQEFYLILDLAAGGTSGWFPDNVGGKPWFDNDASAMEKFAKAQSTWSATWPSSNNDRAFRIDYVKMWKLKQGGRC